MNKKVIASLKKFTTSAFGQKVGCVGVPAALLTVISTSMKNGAKVGFGKLGGRVKIFSPTRDMLVSTGFLGSLSVHGLLSKCTRVLGRNLVDARSR